MKNRMIVFLLGILFAGVSLVYIDSTRVQAADQVTAPCGTESVLTLDDLLMSYHDSISLPSIAMFSGIAPALVCKCYHDGKDYDVGSAVCIGNGPKRSMAKCTSNAGGRTCTWEQMYFEGKPLQCKDRQ